jgi:acyl-CoA thioester hydrolase|tara:strand:+ start:1925 stop:2392 length:468 start_codon:yes stop_codon:yes gene_type:complete
MKDKFPYVGDPVTVTNDMCDLNGHMNVVYYNHIFEDGCWEFYKDMGFSESYFIEGFSSFTLEMNIRYLKELKEGEKGYPCFRMIDVGPKLIHYGGVLLTEDNQVSATTENILAHVDMESRKSSVMPEHVFNNIKKMRDDHSQTGELDFDLRLKIK